MIPEMSLKSSDPSGVKRVLGEAVDATGDRPRSNDTSSRTPLAPDGEQWVKDSKSRAGTVSEEMEGGGEGKDKVGSFLSNKKGKVLIV